MFSLEINNNVHTAFHSVEKTYKIKDLITGRSDAFSLIKNGWRKSKELKRDSNLYIIERLTVTDNLVTARYDFVVMGAFIPLDKLVILADNGERYEAGENGERSFTNDGKLKVRHSVMAVCYDGTWLGSLNKGLDLIDADDLENFADVFSSYLFEYKW